MWGAGPCFNESTHCFRREGAPRSATLDLSKPDYCLSEHLSPGSMPDLGNHANPRLVARVVQFAMDLRIGGRMGLDYGQAEIAAFKQAAASGEVHYEEAAAREAVRQYETLIQLLVSVRKEISDNAEQSGFGGFQSARELQNGFSVKALEGIDIVDQFINGAVDLYEGYRHAGNLFTEQDQNNASAIHSLIKNSAESEPPV